MGGEGHRREALGTDGRRCRDILFIPTYKLGGWQLALPMGGEGETAALMGHSLRPYLLIGRWQLAADGWRGAQMGGADGTHSTG